MSADLPLSTALERIDTWYSKHVPTIHATLRPPASDAELDALEAKTGLKLPQAFRILYKWHDGQNYAAASVFGLAFEPLESVTADWNNWQDIIQQASENKWPVTSISHPTGAIRHAYAAAGWLGFLDDSSGNQVGLDFNPGTPEKMGQVITFGRGQDDKYVLADSLETFLRGYLARLETGRVTAVRVSSFADEWSVQLHDASGHHQQDYGVLADLFPGFGAAPKRFTR